MLCAMAITQLHASFFFQIYVVYWQGLDGSAGILLVGDSCVLNLLRAFNVSLHQCLLLISEKGDAASLKCIQHSFCIKTGVPSCILQLFSCPRPRFLKALAAEKSMCVIALPSLSVGLNLWIHTTDSAARVSKKQQQRTVIQYVSRCWRRHRLAVSFTGRCQQFTPLPVLWSWFLFQRKQPSGEAVSPQLQQCLLLPVQFLVLI